MKKRWWIVATVAALILLGIWFMGGAKESVPAIQLKSENVTATLTVTGEVKGDITVALSPPVSAKITDIQVDEGDTIVPGQLLVALETAPVRSQLSQAQSQVAQAQASYQHVVEGTRPEEIRLWEERYREAGQRITQAQAALASAQFKAQDAIRNAQRFESLRLQQMVSIQEYETAQTQADMARQEAARLNADLAASRRQRAQIEAQLAEARKGPTRPEIQTAASATEAAQANVQTIREQLQDYRIVSPMHGIITERLQDPGELARPGQAVLKAVNPASLEVVCDVEENDLAKVQAGEQAYVVFDALPDKALEARIKRVGSEVNPDNGTVEVRVVLEPSAWGKLKGLRLMPGMTADVNVITEHLTNALVLPATAVHTEGNQRLVYVFEQNRLKKRPIQAERISVENFRVISGLQPGDWVAATASDKLLEKRNVKPVPAETLPTQPTPPSGGMGMR
jgi:HlyD family secretion protein